MRNERMLNQIYNAYDGVETTYEEMLTNAKNMVNYIFAAYGWHYTEEQKKKMFAMFCAWVAAADGAPNRKEHEFFVKISGLNVNYEGFRDTGLQMINNAKACEEMKMLNKNVLKSGTNYDYAANIIALCLCGCDGPINRSEINFLDRYICHPDYNPF